MKFKLITLIFCMMFFISLVSAVWWNPFTWFGEDFSYVESEAWYLQYNTDSEFENFKVNITNMDNGKAKVCLIPKLDLTKNDEIVKSIRAILKKEGKTQRTIEPSDMEIESDSNTIKKICVDVDKVNEDYAKFGSNSIVVEYTNESVTLIDENDNVVLEGFLITENFTYKNNKPHKNLGVGYQLTHTVKLKSYQEFTNVLNDVNLINMRTSEPLQKQFDVKLRYLENYEVPTYTDNCTLTSNSTQVCESVQNGTKIKKRYAYMDLAQFNNSLNMSEGEKVYVAFFMDIKQNDYLDIVPQIAGVNFNFWASVSGNLNTDLEAYYQLNETSGVAVDEKGINNGTVTGATRGVDGILNRAYNFDGLDDYVNFSSNTSIDNVFDGGGTISVWFNVSSGFTDNTRILDKSNNAGSKCGWSFMVVNETAGNASLTFIQGAGGACNDRMIFSGTQALVPVEEWVNLVIVYNNNDSSNDPTIYINNKTQMPLNNPTRHTVISGDEDFNLLLARSSGTDYVNASIDEIGIWKRELSQSEIELLWNNGDGLPYSESSDPKIEHAANNPEGNYNTAPQTFNITFINVYDNIGVKNVSLYVDSVRNLTNSSGINNTNYTFTQIFTDGTYNYYGEVYDDENLTGLTSTKTFTIDSIFPSINITSPVSSYGVLVDEQLIDLNYSVNDTNRDVCWFNYPDFRNLTNTSKPASNQWNFTYDILTKGYDVNVTRTSGDTFRLTNVPSECFIDNVQIETTIAFPSGNVILRCVNSTGSTVQFFNQNLGGSGTIDNVTLLPKTNVTDCTINSSNFTYVTDYDNLTFFANDTLGNQNSEFRGWKYYLFQSNITFPETTTEGAIETFTLTGLVGDISTIQNVFLIYDGESYTGTFNASTGNVLLSDSIIIPNVDNETNVTFYWSILFNDGSTQNTSNYNVTVSSINIDDCSNFSTLLFNYTLVDEGNQTKIENSTALNKTTTIEVDLEVLTTDRTTSIINYSTIYNNTNPASICLDINLTSTSYVLDSIVRYTATGYAVEYYNIFNFSLNSNTINNSITLYDLVSGDSTEFQLTFTDGSFIPVEDALVYVDRQYVGENAFKTVEVPKIDANGQTVLHLVRNDVIYNLRMILNGSLIGSFKNINAFCDDFSIGDCKISLSATEGIGEIETYNTVFGITFSGPPSYNNATNEISFTFTSTDSNQKTVLLEVERSDAFGNRSICSSTLTSTSGVVSCNIGSANISDSELISYVSVNGNIVSSSIVEIDNFSYGNMGFIAWFIFTLIIVIGARKSRTLMLIGVILSYFGAVGLGITRGGGIGIATAGAWIIVITLAALWALHKRRVE